MFVSLKSIELHRLSLRRLFYDFFHKGNVPVVYDTYHPDQAVVIVPWEVYKKTVSDTEEVDQLIHGAKAEAINKIKASRSEGEHALPQSTD